MTADECPQTGLDRIGCAHCRPAPAQPVPADDHFTVVATFPAGHPGRCVDCGDRFDVDDVIGMVSHDDGGGYVCEECTP